MKPAAILRCLVSLAFAAVVACAARAEPLSFRDLLAREQPRATARIAYGSDAHQFGDLWLPAGKGPHPVIVLVHGGCWDARLPGLELMAYAAEDLRRGGYAVWNIEYRRLGHAGGGYPGTFDDVGNAIDHLRALAKRYPLNLGRIVIAGHSAGGHLAFRAVARGRAGTPRRADALPLRGAVSLAGILDLAAYRDRGPGLCGEPRVIDLLVDAGRRDPRTMFADTSPAAMLPLGVPQVVISGALDPIVPASFGVGYAVAARAAGDRVQEITIPGAGHFELIDPQSEAFRIVRSTLARLVTPRTR